MTVSFVENAKKGLIVPYTSPKEFLYDFVAPPFALVVGAGCFIISLVEALIAIIRFVHALINLILNHKTKAEILLESSKNDANKFVDNFKISILTLISSVTFLPLKPIVRPIATISHTAMGIFNKKDSPAEAHSNLTNSVV